MKRPTLALLLFLLAGCATVPHPLTTQEALDRWAAALGGRERLARIRTVYREAAITTGGVAGTEKSWTASDGRLRSETVIAGFTETTVFDGRDAWTVAGGGQPHRAAGGDLEQIVNDSYFGSFAQFFPERRRAAITLAADDGPYAVLSIRPEGGREARILLDRTTWLPHAIRQQVAERTQTFTISGWTEAGAVRFPQGGTQSTGEAKFDVGLRYTKTDLDPPVEAAMFSKPEPAQGAVRFAGGGHETAVPFDLVQNHIFFPLTINGSGPIEFLYDTGADVTVIDKARATALGLPMKGSLEIRGSGPESAEMSIVAGPKLAFGGAEMELESMVALDFGALALREGRPIDGVIGYGVTSQFIIDVDYARRELRFHDPASYTPSPAATPVPFTFDGNTPIMRVRLTDREGKSHEARLLVDTGARGAISLNRPFLEKTKLAVGPAIEGPLGAGVGGSVIEQIGRLGSIEIGGFKLEQPVTAFARATSGSKANPEFDGLLGGEILRRFTLTVDYPHERLLFEKNSAFGEPFEYGMSGLLLTAWDAKFDRVRVADVIAGSPAAEAGIAKDDELVALDGAPVKGRRLDELRAVFFTPAVRHTVTLRRGGKTMEVAFTTRRLV